MIGSYQMNTLIIKPQTKIFSPGNLRAVNDNEKYNKIVQNWIKK